AEESSIPPRKIGVLILRVIIVVGIWYSLIMLANGFLATPAQYKRGFGGIGVITALEIASGSPLLAKTVLVGVIFGLVTTWNGFVIGASRLMYSMARAKMLPDIFAKLHARHQTPTASIIFICLIGCFTPLVGNSILGWFINAESLALVVAYISITASFLVLRKKEPEMNRPFVVKGGMLVGSISFILSIIFFVLYLPVLPGGGLVWQEWVVVAIWCLMGYVMYVINMRQHGDVTAAEREYLIFGEKYGRKSILCDYLRDGDK
ncbi:MAG: APC family permease, partial [Bacteroidales bacterium]